MKICKEFYFDSSHYLPGYKGKCEQVHGHTYKLEVVVEGKKGKDGMVLDFNVLGKVVNATVLEELDHRNLNEIFDNPTAENIAAWIFKKLKPKISVQSVRLWEGKGKWVEATKEDAQK
jgi:6-pyruvoyltetrahydropterin/6-carboxytetrahydropterin synthase